LLALNFTLLALGHCRAAGDVKSCLLLTMHGAFLQPAICISHDLHFACLFSCAVAYIMLLLAGWHCGSFLLCLHIAC